MWLVRIAGADTEASPALLKAHAGVQGDGYQASNGPPRHHSTFFIANSFIWAAMCAAQGISLD